MLIKQNPAKVIHLIGFSICVSLLGDLTLFAALPVNAAKVGITLAQVGILLGVHRLIRVPGNTIGGLLINNSRRKQILVVGLLLATLSTFSYGFVSGFWLFLLSRLMWGLAWILLYITSMTILMDVTQTHNRGKWNGVYNTWYLVGIAGGSFAGGYFTEWIGLQKTMVYNAIASLVGLLVILIFLPETRPTAPVLLEKVNSRRGFGILLTSTWQSFFKIISKVPGLGILLILFMINQFVGEGVALSTLTLLLQNRFGDSIPFLGFRGGVVAIGGSLIALRFILSALFSPVVGKLSDQIFKRYNLLLFGISCGVVSFFLIGLGPNLWLIIMGVVGSALSGSILLVVLAAQLGDLSPSGGEGAIFGLYATAGDIGSAIGPLFAYLFLPVLNISYVYIFCGFLFMLAFWMLRRFTLVFRDVEKELI